MSHLDSRRRVVQVVGSVRMLGQLTAQFAIVQMPEHRSYRKLLLARAISALGTWTAFFAVRIAIYNQTNSAWWISILLFCELVPGVILGIAIGPLIDRWSRKRMMVFSDLGGAVVFAVAPLRPLPGRHLRALGRGGLLGRVLPPELLLGRSQPRARGLARRRERPAAGSREPRHPARARLRRHRRAAPRLEHRLPDQRSQLRRLGPAHRPHRRTAPVDRAFRPGSAVRTGARCARGCRSSGATATCRRSS